MTIQSPIIAVVGLVLIKRDMLLAVRRNTKPHIGKLALPSGYVERGNDWRTVLEREISEQTNVVVSKDPRDMIVYDAQSTPDGQKLLLFAVVRPAGVRKVLSFEQNAKVTERVIEPFRFFAQSQLCFALHNEVLERYRDQYISRLETATNSW